jgi:RNA polymerase sigma-70 factor (ECF subfamily)
MDRTPNEHDLAAHNGYLLGYALRSVRDRDLAQDLVQDTLVAALSAQTPFAGRSSLRTWLVGILKHKILDAFRERARAPVSLEAMQEEGIELDIDAGGPLAAPSAGGIDPAQALEHARFWQAFERELARMPARMAEAFVLTELTTMDASAVCSTLDVTPNALWVMRFRAKDALRAALAPGYGS